MKVTGTIIEVNCQFTRTGDQVCNIYLEGMVKIETWNDLAVKCMENLKKGDIITVIGYEKTLTWVTGAGETMSRTVIVGRKVRRGRELWFG